jgi:NAD(P)-dependent dehydrogenase (short-subunit alcohol dehydrogenase family)
MKNAPDSDSQTRIVVITGCSRGLGRAMVEGFIKRGDTVIGCARNADHISELSAQFPDRHQFRAVDVADDSAVATFADEVIDKVGVPDLLLNNAGVINANAPLWEVSAEEFARIIEVNLAGVANMVRHFVPAMIAGERDGVIVNFSSGWGRSTSPEVAPYCATKWGIEGLTSALAQELPGGMAAVALNPGVIDTDMLRSCFGGDASSYADPQSWAKTAVPFLANLSASDNGRALTAP